jgi:hypothetical protein
MSLSELRQHVLENVFLTTDMFAEEATYTPAGGAPQSLKAHVRYRKQTQTNDRTRDETEVIEVLVSRDPTNTAIGGIDRPQSGDRFTRPSERDPDCRPFSFTGEIVDETTLNWRLVFSRRRRTIQGRGT